MKRLPVLLVACAVLTASSGCAYAAGQAAQQESCYHLYYTQQNLESAGGGDAVAAEPSTLRRDDSRSTAEQALTLVSQLLDGPAQEGLSSPFPAGTELLSVSLTGTHARTDFSAAYGTLSGVALTLADYCVALTLTQLPEISTVSVTVLGQELAYRDTQSFAASDVLFSSTEDVVSTVRVTLYFLNDGGSLTGEERTLELYEGDTQARALVEALEAGPEDRDLVSALPEGFTVQSVWMEDDTCYVSLSSSALQEIPKDADLSAAIGALARSLCSLNTVSEVQMMVDGEFASRYGGVEINRPFGR